MTEPTLSDCINYMKQQLKGMEKYPKSYEFNIPYYRKTIEYLEKGRPHGVWKEVCDFDGNHYKWECSVCGRLEEFEEDFCNCGADMRKEGEAE